MPHEGQTVTWPFPVGRVGRQCIYAQRLKEVCTHKCIYEEKEESGEAKEQLLTETLTEVLAWQPIHFNQVSSLCWDVCVRFSFS